MQDSWLANSTCFYRSFGLGTQFSALTDSAPPSPKYCNVLERMVEIEQLGRDRVCSLSNDVTTQSRMLLDNNNTWTLLLKGHSLLCRLWWTVELKKWVHLNLEQAMCYLCLRGLCDGLVVRGQGQRNFLGRFIHYAAWEVLLLTTWWRIITEQVITFQVSDCLHDSLQVLSWCAGQIQPKKKKFFFINLKTEDWRGRY